MTNKKLLHLTTVLQICGWGKGQQNRATKTGKRPKKRILEWEKWGYLEVSKAKTENIAECIRWKKAKLIEYQT